MTSQKRIYDRCAEYVRYVNKRGSMTQRDDVSEFWGKIFQEKQRLNYPEFNDMLVMRRGATYPLADPGVGTDLEVEYRRTKATYDVVSRSVPDTYFQGLQESPIGCPLCFDFNGRMFSAGGIINALTAYRILKWCQSTMLSSRPLRILEIGAGYGQVAYQLLQTLKVKSYAICDLPENLFLSAFYLQANFPDKRAVFVSENGFAADDQIDFVFLAPPFLKTLHGEFDLVINSYSFQEMNRASVDAYFAFVETSLANDGLFYSLNAHRKSGVVWPSDYPIERFKLVSLLPVRKYPFQVFATNPYEIVMTKRTAAMPSTDAVSHFKRRLDALGGAFQLGLDEEIMEVSRKFSRAELDKMEEDWLDTLYEFLRVGDYHGKKELLAKMRLSGDLPRVMAYLSGSLEFAFGHFGAAEIFLREAVTGAPSSHAQVLSYIMLACLAYRAGDKAAGDARRLEAERIVSHLAHEISRLVHDYDVLAHQVAYQLYLDLSQQRVGLRRLFARVWRKHLKMRDSVRATRHSKTRHLTPFDGLMLESTGIK